MTNQNSDTPATIADAGDPIVNMLDRERAAFLAAVGRVRALGPAERPSDGRWSLAQIVEHVARVDGGVARMIAHLATKPRTATPEQLEAARLTPERAAQVRDRKVKIEAPERVRPGAATSLDDALALLAGAREAMLDAYRTADPALLDGATWDHPHFGPITLRGWVELAAHHDARHAQQVEELASGAEGPHVE
jgi:hypothetical protein